MVDRITKSTHSSLYGRKANRLRELGLTKKEDRRRHRHFSDYQNRLENRAKHEDQYTPRVVAELELYLAENGMPASRKEFESIFSTYTKRGVSLKKVMKYLHPKLAHQINGLYSMTANGSPFFINAWPAEERKEALVLLSLVEPEKVPRAVKNLDDCCRNGLSVEHARMLEQAREARQYVETMFSLPPELQETESGGLDMIEIKP